MRSILISFLLLVSLIAEANHFGLAFYSSSKRGVISSGTGRTWGDNTYAKSCNEYKNPSNPLKYSYKGSTGDGIYAILPTGQSTPFNVLCDMTTDGGGWTNINTSFGTATSVIYTSNGAMGLPASSASTSKLNGGYFTLTGNGTCAGIPTKLANLSRAVITSLSANTVKVEGSAWAASGEVRCGGGIYGTGLNASVRINAFPDKELAACDNNYTNSGYGSGYGFGAVTSEVLMHFEMAIPATGDLPFFAQANLCSSSGAGSIAEGRIQSVMVR